MGSEIELRFDEKYGWKIGVSGGWLNDLKGLTVAESAGDTLLDLEDTRFARRASRESDGLVGRLPWVALSESGNPGLMSVAPLGQGGWRIRGNL